MPTTSESDQIIAGLHSVRTALKHGGDKVRGIWFDAKRHDKRLKQVLHEAKALGIALHPVDKGELAQRAPGLNHQGVVAVTVVPGAKGERELYELLAGLDAPLILVLDGVLDPHNLGACLRTADAAGVAAVVTPKDNAVGLTPVACKVASGAAETVPFFQVTNLVRTLKHLQDELRLFVIGAAGEAEADWFDLDLKGPLAIVMGGEEKGLRRLVREQCDQLARLPMAGTVESLNVSVAAGVCLYQAVRQRRAG